MQLVLDTKSLSFAKEASPLRCMKPLPSTTEKLLHECVITHIKSTNISKLRVLLT